ncbi:iron-siderophore ABC transporter permease [Saccharospirillum sp. MSK14-1]|uniref:FecCD family ABC transporter permease n=1 Tax=Saccharospirillum sp. MSK14-1 TaxID=1897632 RepID=UPI000D3D617D|nr:iron ABC transporter permease [Saccharospirillum sp. MSK14-1]PTY38702.1 iron-siderophore ABC transporter permease [Saccharospirillum sp. MSK14-1]
MLHTPFTKSLALSGCLLLTLVTGFASIALGQTAMSLDTVWQALFAYDDSVVNHIIVRANRLNRAVLAVLVGSSLAVSGALMQALTRNALASPSLFGINAGALFFVALAFTFLSLTSVSQFIWFAYLGAAVAGVLVYVLGMSGPAGLSPVRIVLAGAAMTALFVAFTQGLLILNQESLEGILYWLGGSVAGTSFDTMKPFVPFFLIALFATALLVRQINLMMLDEAVARSLGQRVLATRLALGAIVVVLAGGSVALAGMIGFIGLIIPHLARGLFGRDHRWVLPASALLGASLMLGADTLSRFIVPPQEIPVGALTALVGTPFFIIVARKRSPAL